MPGKFGMKGCMVTVETPRLILASTPLHIITTRLSADDFRADVPLDRAAGMNHAGERIHVHFPPEWPGDALGLFPTWKAKIEAGEDYDFLTGTIIERNERVAIGGIGLFQVAPPDDGALELGYGVNPAYSRRGYATEAVQGLLQWSRQQPNISNIVAACLENNIGSIRVLEKSGFIRTGTRLDEEGPMILWDFRRSPQ